MFAQLYVLSWIGMVDITSFPGRVPSRKFVIEYFTYPTPVILFFSFFQCAIPYLLVIYKYHIPVPTLHTNMIIHKSLTVTLIRNHLPLATINQNLNLGGLILFFLWKPNEITSLYYWAVYMLSP